MNVLITGGTGMVGSAFQNLETSHNLVLVGSYQYDLRKPSDTAAMMRENCPDAIIHLAARVGGVKGNNDYVADFFSDNVLINTNVLNCAHKFNIPKVVSLLSTCVYPDKVSYPLTEDQIHAGPPHSSNFGYAHAKRMLDVHSRALRKQYGRDYVTVIPNNIYGPNDNYQPDYSHVVPAMIRNIYEAQMQEKPVSFWGSGNCLREFTFSKDIADILLWSVENYSSETPMNIGNPSEVTIKDLAETLLRIMEYAGPVIWDTTQPEGQYRKPSSNQNFINAIDHYGYTSLEIGLRKTVKWFLENYPNIRGFR
jgi:GDP-L-fucose synthase